MNMILDQACRFLHTHLTQIPKIEEMVVNPNFTGVLLENQDMGMAINIRKGVGNEAATSIKPIEDLIGLGGFPGLERLSKAADPLMFSVKVALINALSKPFMTVDFLQARGYETARGRDNYSIKDRLRGLLFYRWGFMFLSFCMPQGFIKARPYPILNYPCSRHQNPIIRMAGSALRMPVILKGAICRCKGIF